ncbi:LamG-like jellyroll fold domain-containing protein [Novipirellula artificiosorum]|uniref:LamG-like jellyroll fold domain-containing protein n=1 Tax=Novipirellula artificiosorum TaxID=2528016 RepID=UPI0011B6FF08|nr:LamG-like jellyroll fold domain-containing protein [Novipirellula artificiosorum]
MKTGLSISPSVLVALFVGFGMAAVHPKLGQSSHADDAAMFWSDSQSEILPTGDLQWKPSPFAFRAVGQVRYVDFDNGTDTNPGTRDEPWKHHPWDANATDHAAKHGGICTYVFRRGVQYRGTLIATESGQPGNPIRLTSDPEWGSGPAALVGSERVTNWVQGVDHPDIPEPDCVWYADLDFQPRNLWCYGQDGDAVRIPLARTPNWQVSDPDDIKSQWYSFNNPDRKDVWGAKVEFGGIERPIGYDTVHLTQEADTYNDALIWSEYGWVMGTPYPSKVVHFDAEKRGIVFGGQWGNSIGSYHYPRHTRYYLEDKPHYLDDAKQGEFWFERRGAGGRLYLRLPGDADPNESHIEAAKRIHLIDSQSMNHVEFSGLDFRFTNVPFDLTKLPGGPDADPGCIRLRGNGQDITVSHCRFSDVHTAVRVQSIGEDTTIDQVRITDNVIGPTDHAGLVLHDGGGYGSEYPLGRLLDVKVLRNRLHHIGQRPTRYGQGHAIDIECAETLEVAGNQLSRIYGSGIFVFGGKRQEAKVDRPLTRILIHHNKVIDPLLNSNDWGGIETWQGGPAYVFNNISGNPGGFKAWGNLNHAKQAANSRFGHAYYMDGAFKQYYFNNIAWGKSSDPFDALGNTSAFQEIHGYACSIFNNTIYNFVIGSRRQSPVAGRNKYLGNLWQSIGHMVFRHADPKNLAADPNAADAGAQPSSYQHATNAYANNLFFETPEMLAVFEPSGRWHASVDGFRRALRLRGSLGDVGEQLNQSPLVDAAAHDFRPTGMATDKGVKVFVPWALYAPVAEWNFYHSGDDPTQIPDDHFYLAASYVDRTKYHDNPTYPLHAINLDDDAYERGPLEDWIPGAVRFNGIDQYATVAHEAFEVKSLPSEEPKLSNTQHAKITFEVPDRIHPGNACEVRLRLSDVPPGIRIKADLHWQKSGGGFGGVNANGGTGYVVEGEGPYVFTFDAKDKLGLGHYIVTAYLTPSGEWQDRVDLAQWKVPAASVQPTEGYPNASIRDSNFLIECYFKTQPQHAGGILCEKMSQSGYRLFVANEGGVTFQVAGQDEAASIDSRSLINDGRWHHVIVEADRKSKQLRIYIDGRLDAQGPGIGAVSLENQSDFYVAGRKEGHYLSGTIDFVRIALGTLADAKTAIEELYAWQFDGPFLKDFVGHRPIGRRDAGALERVDPMP